MLQQPKEVREKRMTRSERLAARIATFTGSMAFVWIHVTLFVLWIVANLFLSSDAWDPYPYIFLTLVVSLEAIFLSTFVLIAQNRESKRNEIREQLDYEVNVKAEKEIQEIKQKLDEVLRFHKQDK